MNNWPLYNLHTRLVRARKAGRGIRLTEMEFSLIIEETDLLDQLWRKVSDGLKSEGYERSLTKSKVRAVAVGQSRSDETDAKEIALRLLRRSPSHRIEEHELPSEPFEIELGKQKITDRKSLRAFIQKHQL